MNRSRSIFYKDDGTEARKKLVKTFYDNWSEEYDNDMIVFGYRLPGITATLLLENMENSKEEDCFVLDIGAGTGAVGKELRKKEFKGILHAVDASVGMLKVAERKRIYDDIYDQFLIPEESIGINDDLLYDGLACIGAIGSNHISPKMLPVFVNHVKSDGVLVFSVANHAANESFIEQMEETLSVMVNAKLITEVSKTRERYFVYGNLRRNEESFATCNFYCYVKL